MTCSIFRNDEGKVERVIAPNGEESRLYTDILAHPDVQGDEDLAVDLYLTAYTPSFKSYFGDFENGEIKGVVDANNEPFLNSVLNFLNLPEKTQPRVIKKAAESPKEIPTEIPVMKSVANVNKVLDRLKEKFGIEYEMVNEPNADWKGKFENGKVYINGAKDITKDTAFHEYLHPFVSSLKVENPTLHEKLINELQSLEDGRAEIEAVKQTAGYAGLTQEEILDEALVSYLGKLASGNITLTGDVVESKVERVRQSMLTQFTNWVKRMFSKLFSVKLKDFNLKYNLQDIANVVSTSDVKIDLSGLPISSTPQYQLSDETKKFKQKIKSQANDLQNRVIDDLLFEAKPGEPDMGKVILEEENHVYIHTQTGQTYKSVTTAIKGELDDPEGLYELNRIFGNHFDKILQNIILGRTYEQSKADMTGAISEEISKTAYQALQGYVIGVMSDGSIILPQVILSDPQSGIAGSLDIFIVKPDGKVFITDLKVSKNSYMSNYYRTEKHDVGKGSVFTGQQLTTQQQHGIQVATYKRLAEVNGYQIEGISTLHIILDVEGKTKQQKVKDFQWEGLQVHQSTSNETFVDKVVPTKSNRNKIKGFRKALGLQNPANDDDFLDDEEAVPESVELPEDTKNLLQNTLDIYVNKLYQRMEYLKNLNKTRFSVFSESSREQAVDRISELLTSIEVENLGKPDRAFGALLRYTKETLDNLYRYINDPDNVGKPEYIDIILEAEKFVESYRDIASVPEMGLGSQEQYKEMRAVQSRLNAVKAEINPALEAYVKDLIRTKSSNQLTEEELSKLLKEGFDISLDEYAVTDMQNTKERLLAIAANLYTEASQKTFNKTDGIIEDIKKAGNRLANALGTNKIDFSFMLMFDKLGEFTGRYLENIGQKYYDLKKKLYADLKDENGDNLEYVIIENLEEASLEDIQHNIELQKKKEKLREFLQTEKFEGDTIVSGEYHRLSDEFRAIRAKYEVAVVSENGKLFWKKRSDVTDEDYRKFLNRYYDRAEYVSLQFEKDGSYKGRTKPQKEIGYFPKKEYVEVKEVTSSGVKMTDPRYDKIMNPTTEVERAQKEFYQMFVSRMKEALEKLPVDVQKKMLGKVGRVKDNYINNAKKKGGSFFTAVTKNMREWFDLSGKVHSVQRLTDDNGVIVDSLPILYTNDPRNEKKIESIKEKIKDLKNKYIVSKSITTEDYEEELKKLEYSLAVENGKLDFKDINQNLVENLIAFTKMAEKYEQMSNIESALLAISKTVEKKKYYQSNSIAEKFTSKGKNKKDLYKKEGESLAYQRMKKWFKMVYYNNDEYDYSTFAQVADRLQNITSLKGIGLNLFGGVNNYVMGRINNAIEAYGGVYYQRKAYFRATGEYNKDYMPGLMKKIGADNEGPYKIEKPKSKYEAVVEYFRMVRKFQADSGRVDLFSKAYIFQEIGEYNVQSKTGVAVTMSDKFQLTNEETGEKMSIYDAFNFNEATGKLSLKPGFNIDESFKTKVTNYIYEVNKQIHGNYAWEDRMVIQQHALGELGAQFHKWVVPLFNARFKKRYDNEVLGSIEGRYRTFWNVMKYMYQTEQGVTGKLTGMLKATFAPGSVKGLDEYQVRNMYKNLAELGFFVASFVMSHLFSLLASGLDDDDEEVKKLVNFLIYQQTRQQNEIKTFIPVLGIKEQYQMAKSPIAALSTLRDYGEFMASILTMPFPPYDKNYYERGPYKGDLKAWKEAKDILPALNQLNRWESFETVRSFYIR